MSVVRTSIILFLLAFGTATYGTAAFATTHTIQFGGNLGNNYSPNNLNVNVGDTIIWQGSFSFHPLQSLTIPSGAPAFAHTGSDGTFMYVVTMPGTYNYWCTVHTSAMTGKFTAAAAGVPLPPSEAGHELEQNFPNPASHETMIHVMLDKPDNVTLSLYDSKGDLVATILNGRVDAGMHMITLDVMPFPSGSYSYVLKTSGGIAQRTLVVLR